MVSSLLESLNTSRHYLHILAMVILIAFAVGLRVKCFQGYSNSDPREYTILANDLSLGIFHVPVYKGTPVFALRIGLYTPVSLSIRFFGFSEYSIVAYPFCVSILALCLVYIFLRILFNALAGLIGLAIMSVVPIDLTSSSLLYPDLVAAFWANFGIFLTYLSLKSVSDSKAKYIAFIAGGLFGISWLCKESVIYLTPVVLVLCLFPVVSSQRHRRLKTLFLVGGGAMVILGAELLFLFFRTEDFFFHFHELERNNELASVWFFNESSPIFGWKPGEYWIALLKRILYEGPKRTLLAPQLGFIPGIGFFVLVYGIIYRRREILFPGIWLGSLLLFYIFGSTSFSSYRPIPLFDRYLYPLLLPSCILAAGFASHLLVEVRSYTSKKYQCWAICYVVAIFIVSLVKLPEKIDEKVEHAERTVASLVGHHDIVFSHAGSVASLVFFRSHQLSQDSLNRSYRNIAVKDIPVGSFVLVNLRKTWFFEMAYGYQRETFEDIPPANWRELWSEDYARLYKVE